ncbi:MAG TPA: pentapeptide repeat-containing protein [Labilithrix sp.]|nr:pentapeptide repeat-containing protein [Labilithrix sp.]
MATTPSLGELLKLGSAALNKLRAEGKLPLDFTGATLTRVFCANANLSALELTGSEWERCELSKVVFRDADLSNAYFHGGRLDDCDFTGANLEGATFEKVRLGRCDFTGARGLDEVELNDVTMHDVIGLEEEDDEDEDDDDESDALVHLRDRLPKGFRRLPLDALLAEASKVVKVETGAKGTEADVQALETALGTKFPADYRAFLMRFGHMKIIGNTDYTFGYLDVFGLPDLEKARQAYLAEFAKYGFDPKWLDARSTDELPAKPTGSIAQRRVALRDALKLADVHMKRFFGDPHDQMRIAYQFMIPVMATPDELHTSVDCVGPDTQMYTVAIKDRAIEAPSGTFTSRLLEHLENVVVGEGKRPVPGAK